MDHEGDDIDTGVDSVFEGVGGGHGVEVDEGAGTASDQVGLLAERVTAVVEEVRELRVGRSRGGGMVVEVLTWIPRRGPGSMWYRCSPSLRPSAR